MIKNEDKLTVNLRCESRDDCSVFISDGYVIFHQGESEIKIEVEMVRHMIDCIDNHLKR